MIKEVKLRFPRITVIIREDCIIEVHRAEESQSIPYTPEEIEAWINAKSVLREFALSEAAIKKLKKLLAQSVGKKKPEKVKKPILKETPLSGTTTHVETLEQYCEFVNSAIDKVENGPPSKSMEKSRKFIKSIPEPDPIKRVRITASQSLTSAQLAWADRILDTGNTVKPMATTIIPKQDTSLQFRYINNAVTYIVINGCLNVSLSEFASFIKNLYKSCKNKTDINLIKYKIESLSLLLANQEPIPINTHLLQEALNFYLKFKGEIDKTIPSSTVEELREIIDDITE
jgi:hypothetical protein